MNQIKWKVFGVSLAGFSHQADGRNCEDYHALQTVGNGWLVAALSDGAGSAIRSIEGAKAICEGVVSAISSRLALSDQIVNEQVETSARSWIEESIERVRSGLLSKNHEAIAEFHATLVGVIAGQNGGLFFHIGDGAACAMVHREIGNNVMSLPENGEYANETYFFTENSWKDHLRFTSFGPEFDVIAIMTDGVTPFALASKAHGPYAPFFDPVARFLEIQGRDEGERGLSATLGSDAIRKITDDDKTLVWALKVQADGS